MGPLALTSATLWGLTLAWGLGGSALAQSPAHQTGDVSCPASLDTNTDTQRARLIDRPEFQPLRTHGQSQLASFAVAGSESSEESVAVEVTVQQVPPLGGGGSSAAEPVTAGGPEARRLLGPLRSPDTQLEGVGTGVIPKDSAAQYLPERVGLPVAEERGEQWRPVRKEWLASNLTHHPLYHEDIMLERHGHQRWPLLQPAVSGARFFGGVILMPYKLTLKKPWEEEYTLGHIRPGTPAPPLYQRPPYDRKATMVQLSSFATGWGLLW
jgi:hypothetical protein